MTSRAYNSLMQAGPFDEIAFFRAVAASGARTLLIGRRALVALGVPVLTADYDYWIHIDDIAAFNAALEPMDLHPDRPPERARATGRYVLENDEKVDVRVARRVPTYDGTMVAFDDLWARRQAIHVAPDVPAALPTIDDLILTKRFGRRPRDADDIRALEMLRKGQAP